MTKNERRMWVRWIQRKFRSRPRMFFADENWQYSSRSRRWEMYCFRDNFAEAYLFIHNRRRGMSVREARLSITWGDVRKFLSFTSRDFRSAEHA